MKNTLVPVLLLSIMVLTSVVVYSADAAGIPKKAISIVGQFLTTDLPTTTVFNNIANSLTGANSIDITNTGLVIRNPANTHSTTLAGGAVAANETLNLPAIAGTDTLATLGLGQTFTGLNVLNDLSDSSFIVNNADNTKKIGLSLSGMTTGKTLTLSSSQTTTQTLAIPNVNSGDSIATTEATQTLTSKTISASSNTITDTSAGTGDLLKYNGTGFVRFAKGSGNQTLMVNKDGTNLEYVTNAVIYKASTTTYSSTAANDPELYHSLSASTTYAIHAVLLVQCGTTNKGIKIDVTVPASSTISIGVIAATSASAVANSVITTSGTQVSDVLGVTTELPIILDGTVTTSSTAGNIQIQGAEASTAAVTINAGSYLEIKQVDS